jgi:phosphoribosylglycinamide formyltransferase 1
MKNIVILISGGGSNMAAIVQTAQRDHWARRYGAQVSAVISNRAGAKGLEFAKAHGIATQVIDHKAFAHEPQPREAFDAALMAAIEAHQPCLVVLAGFMRILTPGFVAHYQGQLLNIHPSLLPAFPGLHTHERAIEAGCKFAGATVHRVVPVLPEDTPDTLAARVLTQEHQIYPRAIAQLLTATHPATPPVVNA